MISVAHTIIFTGPGADPTLQFVTHLVVLLVGATLFKVQKAEGLFVSNRIGMKFGKLE